MSYATFSLFFSRIFSDATGLYPVLGDWKRFRFLNINKLIYHVQSPEDRGSPRRQCLFCPRTARGWLYQWPGTTHKPHAQQADYTRSEDEIHSHRTVASLPHLKWHTSRPSANRMEDATVMRPVEMPPRNSIWKKIIPNLSASNHGCDAPKKGDAWRGAQGL